MLSLGIFKFSKPFKKVLVNVTKMLQTCSRPCHTLPDIVNGRPTESKIFDPFIFVCILSVFFPCTVNVFVSRRCTFNSAGSFEHAQCLKRSIPGKSIQSLYGCYWLCMRFIRNSCVLYSVIVGHNLFRGRWKWELPGYDRTWHVTDGTGGVPYI